MRLFFICSIMLLMTATSFCQQANPPQPLTKNDYLQKSKNQKTAAWVLLGGGLALAVGGALLDVNSDWSSSETPYLVVITAGCASMLGSIPLFISAAKNKRKAMNAAAYIGIQRDPAITNSGLTLHSVPTLLLKLNF
jgi:hypothetical protein